MKQKLLVFMLFLMAGSGASKLTAQSLVVKTKDGTEYSKQLEALDKLTFASSNLWLTSNNGSTESYSLSDIRKIYFSNIATSIANVLTTTKMVIYPNPVKNQMYVRNITDKYSTVSIFRMDGVMVLSTEISSNNNSIDVSNLEKGLYLLKVNNQALKFIKL